MLQGSSSAKSPQCSRVLCDHSGSSLSWFISFVESPTLKMATFDYHLTWSQDKRAAMLSVIKLLIRRRLLKVKHIAFCKKKKKKKEERKQRNIFFFCQKYIRTLSKYSGWRTTGRLAKGTSWRPGWDFKLSPQGRGSKPHSASLRVQTEDGSAPRPSPSVGGQYKPRLLKVWCSQGEAKVSCH